MMLSAYQCREIKDSIILCFAICLHTSMYLNIVMHVSNTDIYKGKYNEYIDVTSKFHK